MKHTRTRTMRWDNLCALTGASVIPAGGAVLAVLSNRGST